MRRPPNRWHVARVACTIAPFSQLVAVIIYKRSFLPGIGNQMSARHQGDIRYGLDVVAPWSDRLTLGLKLIETREYALPDTLLGVPMAMISTGRKTPDGQAGLLRHCSLLILTLAALITSLLVADSYSSRTAAGCILTALLATRTVYAAPCISTVSESAHVLCRQLKSGVLCRKLRMRSLVSSLSSRAWSIPQV